MKPLVAAVAVLVALATSAWTPQVTMAQQPAPGERVDWTVPRTPGGRPDLQGVWTNATITPYERGTTIPYTGVEVPAAAADRAVFTDEEIARLEAQTAIQRPAFLGAYNVWMDAGDRLLSTRQTSLVVDPPDGRVPVKPWAEAARDRAFDRQRDDYRAMSTWDRCITRGVPGSMLPTGYNNAYRILQTGDTVAVMHEMIHDARIIPLSDRSHVDGRISQWMGDARAHWEGDTLVVETRNFSDQGMIVTGTSGGRLKGLPVSDAMRVVERYARVSENKILWEVTIDDPVVYERPWTISMPLTRVPGYEMYEYACHEGNRDVEIYLGGGRVDER